MARLSGPSSGPSLLWRVVGAVALTIGFYGLAIGIAGFLVFLIYAQIAYAHRLNIRLAIYCVVPVVVIIWAIIPRRDRFVAPGALLLPERHPRLFKEITEVAAAAGQATPAEVYLVPEVNAWVMQRGGAMGMGSRRVMGLGMALLTSLTVPQLRAVVAHEFGHYYGGDTKLGPWIYRTRSTIIRTVSALARHSSFIQVPFMWYGKMFLRITHAVSRQQEYAADRLAAVIAGTGAMISGLEAVHKQGPAFDAFWRNEFVPLVNAGFIAPMADGFAVFTHLPRVEMLTSEMLARQIEAGKASPYDTHPPLRERIASLESAPVTASAADSGERAISLLDDPAGMESEMLTMLTGKQASHGLRPLRWDEVAERVYVQPWGDMVRMHAAALAGLRPSSLPDAARDLNSIGTRFARYADKGVPPERILDLAFTVVGGALALLLSQNGWMPNARPNLGFSMLRGNEEIAPFAILPRLAKGELKPETWLVDCQRAGIPDADLGTLTERSGPKP